MNGEARAVSIAEAARVLDVAPRTVRRWIRDGAPVARRGGRGRGRVSLVCPAAVAAWRRAHDSQAEPGDALLVAAAAVPEILAAAAREAFLRTDGPHKVATALPLALAWYLGAADVLALLRAQCPAIPELGEVPEPIAYLREIGQ